MYAKSTRPSAKRDVQKFRSAQRDDRVLRSEKRDDRIARPRRAQTCERSELRALRMFPRSGQIFFHCFSDFYINLCGFRNCGIIFEHFKNVRTKPPNLWQIHFKCKILMKAIILLIMIDILF